MDLIDGEPPFEEATEFVSVPERISSGRARVQVNRFNYGHDGFECDPLSDSFEGKPTSSAEVFAPKIRSKSRAVKSRKEPKKKPQPPLDESEPEQKFWTNWSLDQCNICFYRVPDLTQHRAWHRDEEDELLELDSSLGARCNVCNQDFKSVELGRQHVRLEHLSSSSSACYYLEHLHHDKVFRCKICQLEHRDKDHVISHVSKHHFDMSDSHRNSSYLCSFCREPFNDLGALTDHLESHDCTKAVIPIFDLKVGHSDAEIMDAITSMRSEDGLQCKLCQKTYKTKEVSFHHVKTIHLKIYRCRPCGLNLGTMNALNNHRLIVHNKITKRPVGRRELRPDTMEFVGVDDEGNAKNECKICKISFGNPGVLQDHIRFNHIEEPKFVCNQCNQTFISKGRLINHVQMVHGSDSLNSEHREAIKKYFDECKNDGTDGKFVCKDCDKTVYTTAGFLGHVKKHLGILDHMCEECGRVFPGKHRLSRHMREIHKKSRREAVDPKELKESKSLNKEEFLAKYTRKKAGGMLECIKCLKLLSRRETAVNHVKRVHLNDRSVTCEICSSTHFSVEDLNRHIKRKHNNQEPKDSVKHLKDMEKEEAIKACMFKEGEGESLTKCKMCVKNKKSIQDFVNLERLQMHIADYHLRRKLLQCPHCPQTYNRQQNLTKHIGVKHSDTNPELHEEVNFIKENVERAQVLPDNYVACPLCEKVLRGVPVLKTHLKFVHLNKRDYVCEVCNNEFQMRGQYRYHMKAKHNIDVPCLKVHKNKTGVRRKQVGKLSDLVKKDAKSSSKLPTKNQQTLPTPTANHPGSTHAKPQMHLVANHDTHVVLMAAPQPAENGMLHWKPFITK